MSYYITTDAACDLPKEYYRDFFHVIPMSYTIDGTEYGSDTTLTDKEFFAKIRNGAMPTTALINSYYAKEQLTPLLKGGHDILHLSFSSGLSATYDNLVIACNELREEFPDRKILLLDTLSVSMGLGVILLNLFDNYDNGMSIDDNYKCACELSSNLCHYFTADDLFHLQRGGRVSKATAIIGTALHIKPIMYCNKLGKLAPFDKVVSRKKALIALANKVAEHIDRNNMKYVAIVHGDALEDAQFLAKVINEKVEGIENLIVTFIGPIIGSHTGCGVVATLFAGDTRVEPKDETIQ